MSASRNSSQATASRLHQQWTNPTDVLSILLIIGGDIVQKALAQTTPGRIPTVCFSFGWVAYSFSTLVGVVGDGRLLPPPDYPVKVYNLETNYVRENKSWIIGRILRDNELLLNKQGSLKGAGLRISIYKALDPQKIRKRKLRLSRSEMIWALVTLLQLAVAAVPWGLNQEWGVLLITLAGVLAAIGAGKLPQWNVEKLPLKQNNNKYIALTSGNGSREVMIIYGDSVGWDLEELAAGESPRSDRIWGRAKLFSNPERDNFGNKKYYKNRNEVRRAYMIKGLPAGLWFTRVACFIQAFFWIALLVTVPGLNSNTWYLLLVGGCGMLQNVVVAAVARTPDKRCLPLKHLDTIVTQKVMDGLMDLEVTLAGAGQRLLKEFFPGNLRSIELQWWAGQRDEYDDIRMQERTRDRPRSRLMKKDLGITGLAIAAERRFGRSSTTETWGPVSDIQMRAKLPPAMADIAENHSELPYATPASHFDSNLVISESGNQYGYYQANKSEVSVLSPL